MNIRRRPAIFDCLGDAAETKQKVCRAICRALADCTLFANKHDQVEANLCIAHLHPDLGSITFQGLSLSLQIADNVGPMHLVVAGLHRGAPQEV